MRNTDGLRRGGGRPKGSVNRTTREIKEFAELFLTSTEYIKKAKKRVMDGKAPHLEVLWHHYAFGKPRETVKIEGSIPPFILKFDDGRG